MRPSIFVVAAVLAHSAGSAHAAPVVAGYERFGRHATDEAGRIEAGLLLLGELGCVNCHTAAGPSLAHLAPKQAPVLDAVGKRLDPAWPAAYLADPQAAHPGTTMPDLLAGLPADRRSRTVTALVHYLASTGPFAGAFPGLEKAKAKTGVDIYERNGCAACHGSRRAGTTPLADHRPLGDLSQKWSPAELDAFLKNPTTIRPSGRMPALPLSDDERRHVVAALVGRESLAIDVVPPGGPRTSVLAYGTPRADDKPAVTADEAASSEPVFVLDATLVAEGRAAFTAVGCVNCHRLGEAGGRAPPVVAAGPLAKPLVDLASLDAGCLAERPPATAAAYGLDVAQRASLTAALRWLRSPPAAVTPDRDRAIDRSLAASNCYACHDRHGKGGVLPPASTKDEDGEPVLVEAARDALFAATHAELGDEGRRPPTLTGTGAKLRSAFLREVLLEGGRDRTATMPTRMPKWTAAVAEPLAAALAADPAVSCPVPALAGHDEREIVDQGRHLVGSKALGCIKCHSFAGDKGQSLGLIDMTRMPVRLRHEWFLAYTANPQAFRPGTRMPAAWSDGKTFYPDVLDGTAAGQIEAVWRYLSSPQPRPPVGVGRNMIELVPADRPIIYRNFIENAGPRAIGVGYPEGVHLAWDAEALRLALVWRGEFIDAGRHWTGRGQGWQPPLGDGVFTPDVAAAVEVLPDATAPWPKEPPRSRGARFLGYTLDAAGRPTFRWTLDGLAIEEKLEPAQAGKTRVLRRTLRLTGRPPGGVAVFRGASGRLEDAGDGWSRVDGLWKLRVGGPSAGTAVRHKAEGRSELRYPIVWQADGTAEIVEELAW